MPTGPVADAEIRRRVLEEINNQRWTQPNNIDAKVEDGTVELRGVVLSEAEHAALWVVAGFYLEGRWRSARPFIHYSSL